MRQRAMSRLALLIGAAVAGPAGAWAGAPGGGHVHHPAAPAPAEQIIVHASNYNHDARCMCPDCQVVRAIEKAEGAPVIIEGPGPQISDSVGMPAGVPCTACQASAAPNPGVPMGSWEAPGYARLGGGGAADPRFGGPAMAASEPAPIGVVRTNYDQPSGPVDPAIAAFHQAASPLPMAHGHAAGVAAGAVPQAGPWLGSAPPRRPSVLGHMFGVGGLFGRRREAREARRAAEHAAIPMGMPAASGPITELPASLVYGR